MRRLIISGVAVVLLLAGCGGGDPIDAAENCTELATAIAEVGDLSEDEQVDVQEKLTEMLGDAAADDNGLEFSVCSEVALDVAGDQVEETFEEIEEGLESD